MRCFLNLLTFLEEVTSYHKQNPTFNLLKTKQTIRMMQDCAFVEVYIISTLAIYQKH